MPCKSGVFFLAVELPNMHQKCSYYATEISLFSKIRGSRPLPNRRTLSHRPAVASCSRKSSGHSVSLCQTTVNIHTRFRSFGGIFLAIRHCGILTFMLVAELTHEMLLVVYLASDQSLTTPEVNSTFTPSACAHGQRVLSRAYVTRRMIYWSQYVSAQRSKYRVTWPLTGHKPATWPDLRPLAIIWRFHGSRCNDSIGSLYSKWWRVHTVLVVVVSTWCRVYTITAVDRRSVWRSVNDYHYCGRLRWVQLTAVTHRTDDQGHSQGGQRGPYLLPHKSECPSASFGAAV